MTNGEVIMKDKVLIKSFPNGISIFLDGEAPFEEMVSEISYKFSAAKAFFGDARMALSIEGRELTLEEERTILDIIHEETDLSIVCLVGKQEEQNQQFIKALEDITTHMPADGSDGQFYKGTLKNNQILETEHSIVVLGDVYPGSTIVSAKDIVILGGLYGEAYAGGDGQDGHYVFALEMAPERLKIGDFKYRPKANPKWGIKPKMQPKIAYVKNKSIQIEGLTKDLLSLF